MEPELEDMQQGGKVLFQIPALTYNLFQVCPSLSIWPRGVIAQHGFDKLYSILARRDQVDGRG